MTFTFPNPSVTPQFTGDNGITYAWDTDDKKWQVKGFGASARKRYPDLVMQLRGYFELNGNGEAVLPDGIIHDSDIMGGPDGADVYVMRPGIWWLDPTQSSAVKYKPDTITHFLVTGLRWFDVIDGNGNEIYNDAETTLEFSEGDLIHVRSRATEMYADPSYAESISRDYDNVWRIVKKIPVVDDNNVGQGWGFSDSLWAYEVQKCAPEERYENGWWNLNDDVFAPVSVSPWHGAAKDEMVGLDREVNGHSELPGDKQGRLIFQTYSWDTSNLVDAVTQKAYIHPTENYLAFNHDIVPSGRIDWGTELAPYPRQLCLKFDDGRKYLVTVEFIGVAGHNNRTKNFKILDRGELPLELDLISLNGLQFDISTNYEPERKGLQEQIDELKALVESLHPS